MRFAAVFFESVFQRAEHFVLIAPSLHINKINNDNPADVSEANLIGNFFDRFQIGLQNGLFKIVFSDITPCIDVNHCQCFGLLNDDVAPGFKPYFALQGAGNIAFKIMRVKNRLCAFVEFHRIFEAGHKGIQKR